ncbi:MAG: ATP-binding protein [Methanoregula sp.]|nr:ATP-binding protein [Methanoregula sp.]
MADRKKGLSPDSVEGLKEVIQAIDNTIRDGRIPEGLVISPDEEIRKKLAEILADIVATQQFALAIAHGDLSQDLAVRGHMAGSLKALQSNLRHLTWQAGQIAGGDLSQRVHFMGEFSDSFNAMVDHLADDEINRNVREDELRRVNAALADEVDERRKIEYALRLANKKITMLSSITRHDIRNQLMALRGYLELSRHKISDPVVLAYLKKGDLASEAIGRQIEFTKYYENIGVNAPEWQDILQLIQTAQSQLESLNKIDVMINLPPVTVFADGLIEKVFYNLLENTLRHGERVTWIRFSFYETAHGAEIVYEDNGVGISPEDKQHLFQKGFGKNTGLGLFLSREILAITGLTIQETGEPGKGVRFEIMIPKDAYRFTKEQPKP